MTPDLCELAAALPEPILLITGKGRIVASNQAFCRYFATSRNEMDSLSLPDFASPPDAARQYIRDCTRSRNFHVGSLVLTIGKAKAVRFRCEGGLVRPRQGDDEALVIIRLLPPESAVTHFQRLNRRLEELKKKINDQKRATEVLRTTVKDLESFSYTISHDLRSPLRAINFYSTVAIRDHAAQLPAEVLSAMERIQKNSDHMNALLDDLLMYTQLSRGIMQHRKVNMHDIVTDIVHQLQPLHQGQHFQVTIGDLPAVLADPMLMRRLWENLLSNAFKYSSKQQSPEVYVGSYEENGTVVYFVRDNGAGFSMKHADKLFRVFERLHGNDAYEGTGIGLAIVKQAVTKHGGRVWAKGEVGKGATFFFTLNGSSEDPGALEEESMSGQETA